MLKQQVNMKISYSTKKVQGPEKTTRATLKRCSNYKQMSL